MSPDLNSLPPSRPSNGSRPRRISFNNTDTFRHSPPSPRSPPLASLQAAATINAGLQRTPSDASARNGVQRRRSSLMNNLSINDPAMPAPGELRTSNGNSPRASRRSFHLPPESSSHHRQMSLGELHQELENEQEAQVNRLLYMIRQQQEQLTTLSRQNGTSPTTSEAIIDTPNQVTSGAPPSPRPNSSSSHVPTRRPHSLSRQSSRISASSRGASPALHPVSASLAPLTEDFLLGGNRDEIAFYQAETQNLTRENQMLKHRVRELERLIAELPSISTSIPAHSSHSPLASPPITMSQHDLDNGSATTHVDKD